MSHLFDVAGKTAIVTGASSGLGTAMARGLAEAGAAVVIAARRAGRLERLAAEIAGGGGTVMAFPCDVAEADQVEALVAAAADHFGRVDVLVNNAGTVGDFGPVPERLPHDLFEQTIRTNLLGTWYGCRAAGSRMLADGRGGSIVNISSSYSAQADQNGPVGYSASKGAINNLTRVLAVSWADRGVRVNGIAPGWLPSEMTAGFLDDASPYHDGIMRRQPMRRFGDPQELIGPVLFLASDASSYVTGQTIWVDGGMTAALGCLHFTPELLRFQASMVPDGRAEPIGDALGAPA